jgi:hypothetical protein
MHQVNIMGGAAPLSAFPIDDCSIIIAEFVGRRVMFLPGAHLISWLRVILTLIPGTTFGCPFLFPSVQYLPLKYLNA